VGDQSCRTLATSCNVVSASLTKNGLVVVVDKPSCRQPSLRTIVSQSREQMQFSRRTIVTLSLLAQSGEKGLAVVTVRSPSVRIAQLRSFVPLALRKTWLAHSRNQPAQHKRFC